jgi:YfiH family protein
MPSRQVAMVETFIRPDWPAPAHVHAATTTRAGGVSTDGYASLNLADHVGDDPARVAQNRAHLAVALSLPSSPVWLRQVHGVRVVDAGCCGASPEADAAFAVEAGIVCGVLTADCLPLLLCDREGTRVAAAHAGWRGLAAGVIEASVAALCCPASDLLAWLGPAISAPAYVVGEEVRAAFVSHAAIAAEAFQPAPSGGWQADLYRLARQRLAAVGVDAVYGGKRCTFREPAHFYSYRRDGARSGRMASLIWLEDAPDQAEWH